MFVLLDEMLAFLEDVFQFLFLGGDGPLHLFLHIGQLFACVVRHILFRNLLHVVLQVALRALGRESVPAQTEEGGVDSRVVGEVALLALDVVAVAVGFLGGVRI